MARTPTDAGRIYYRAKGAVLRQLRKRAGLTQAEGAHVALVSTVTWGRWERGGPASIFHVRRFLRELGVSWEDYYAAVDLEEERLRRYAQVDAELTTGG